LISHARTFVQNVNTDCVDQRAAPTALMIETLTAGRCLVNVHGGPIVFGGGINPVIQQRF